MTFDITGPSSISRVIKPIQPEPKNKSKTGSKTVNEKKEKPTKKIKIEMKRKLVKLGIPEGETQDASELEIDWISASQKMEIYCTESKCDFKTGNVDYRCLDSHYKKIHQYGSYPCTKDNCQYIAVKKRILNVHLSKFHNEYQKIGGGHRCSFPNCNKSFQSNFLLNSHEGMFQSFLGLQ